MNEAQKKLASWVRDNLEDLENKYPFEHLVVGDSGVIAHSRDSEKVIDELNKENLSFCEVIFYFVTPGA